MREYWNERAREDAYFFVDSRRSYRDPELSDFWEQGEQDLDRLLDSLDVRIEPGDVVLDLGCGVGRLTRAIAARAARAYGLDVSERDDRARPQPPFGPPQRGMARRGRGEPAGARRRQHRRVPVLRRVQTHPATIDHGGVCGRDRSSPPVPGAGRRFRYRTIPARTVARRRVRSGLQRVRAAAGRSPSGQDDPAWIGSAISLDALHVATFDSGLELERVVGEGTEFCLVLARKL